MGKWSEEVIQRKSKEFAALSAEYTPLDLKGLEAAYGELKKEKEDLEYGLKATNQRLAVLEAIFTERFTEQDIKSMNFESGHKVMLRFESPMKAEDKEAFMTWLKNNGLEYELTVNYMRLQSIAKEHREETGSLPPGIVEGEPVAVVSYRKI